MHCVWFTYAYHIILKSVSAVYRAFQRPVATQIKGWDSHLERRLLQSLRQQLVDLIKTSCTIRNEICRCGINKILMSVCMKSLDCQKTSKIVLVRLLCIKKNSVPEVFSDTLSSLCQCCHRNYCIPKPHFPSSFYTTFFDVYFSV